jgi:hypothetical protein
VRLLLFFFKSWLPILQTEQLFSTLTKKERFIVPGQMRRHWASGNFRPKPLAANGFAKRRCPLGRIVTAGALVLVLIALGVVTMSPRLSLRADVATPGSNNRPPPDDASSGSGADRVVPEGGATDLRNRFTTSVDAAVSGGEWTLSTAGNLFVDELVVSAIADRRDQTRTALMEARIAHAEAHGLAPLRACFVSLIRHSDDGVKKLH